MAIKVQGTTIIDDSRNIVNGIGASFTGIVTASSFSGSGSGLTGVDAATLDGIDSLSFLRSDAQDNKTSGDLIFNDQVKLMFGTGEDLKIQHDSANSYISHEGTGNLFIKNTTDDQDVAIQSDDGSGSVVDYFRADGSTGEAMLYHYGNEKLATKTTGVTVTGSMCATTLYGDGSGLTGIGGTGEFLQDADGNLFAGDGAGGSYDPATGSACFNIFLGCNSGNNIDTGSDNIFQGYYAGYCNTIGNKNIFLGRYAGKCVSSGCCNIFFGASAGSGAAVTGSHNIAVGTLSGRSLTSGTGNVFLGRAAGYETTSCTNNVFIGLNAGRCSDGSSNIFLGQYAGRGSSIVASNTGAENIFLGSSAGYSLTTGGANVFLGTNAGYGNLTGCCNIAIGYESGKCATDQRDNIAMGMRAAKCATGSYNISMGFCGGYKATEDHNIFIGHYAARNAEAGCCNVVIGKTAGAAINGGDRNVFLGLNAGSGLTTGLDNVFLGTNSGAGVVTGGYNVAIGCYAGNQLTSGATNIAIGQETGKNLTTGTRNILFGKCAGCGDSTSKLTGNDNVMFGHAAGAKGTSASNNIFFGSYTGWNNTSGSHNIFMGEQSGYSNTTGGCNIALGKDAGRNGDGDNNVFFGNSAGKCNTGSNNIFLGNEAGLPITTGQDNIFLGRNTGRCAGVSGSCNTFIGFAAGCKTSGSSNNFIGSYSGVCNTTGGCNVFLGRYSGYSNTDGTCNIMIGMNAGRCATTTGNDNIFLGTDAGRNASGVGGCNIFIGKCAGNTNTSGCCNVAIGYDVELPSATGNNQFAIGNGTARWITGDSSFNVTVSTASTFSSAGLNVTGISTLGTVKISSGIVTASSGIITYYGDGSKLSGVSSPASNGEFYTGITSSVQITPLSYETTVHTLPSTSGKQYVIESINVANVDTSVGVGTTVNIIASIEDATAGEQTYIAYNVPIVTGGLIELLKNPIVAGPSDAIKMWTTNDNYTGVSNAVEVYMNYTEFTSTEYISKFASTVSVATTAATTLYTSTTYPTLIEKIGLANRTDAGDYPISIKITNGGTTTYLAKNLIIPRYSTVDILDRPKRIETGATIDVEVGSTSTIDIIIAGKKITS